MLQVRKVGVPSKSDNIHVDDPVLGGKIEEVDQLCRWPHAPVHLGEARIDLTQLPTGHTVPEGEGEVPGTHLVELPEIVLQIMPALLQGLSLQGPHPCRQTKPGVNFSEKSVGPPPVPVTMDFLLLLILFAIRCLN